MPCATRPICVACKARLIHAEPVSSEWVRSARPPSAWVRDTSPARDGSIPDGPSSGDGTSDLAARLLALTAACTPASTGRYATDDGLAPTIDICRLSGAFFWHSDMDVDCDGQTTPECNLGTD